MSDLVCKECGLPRQLGRRLCRPCNLERLKKIAKSKPRYTWDKICVACSVKFSGWRKKQEICSDCYKYMINMISENNSTNNYSYSKIPGRTAHRELAESILNRNLTYNEVIHHVDDNPKNNDPENLILLSRSDHGKLHKHLNLQHLIMVKNTDIGDISWVDSILVITNKWLEEMNIDFCKLSDIKVK